MSCLRTWDVPGEDQLSMTEKVNSASVTFWPATNASPRAFPTRDPARRITTRSSTTSPGTTGFRNLTASIPMKNASFPSSPGCLSNITQPVCAMDSTIRTPGMMGRSGKCPWKNASLPVTHLYPMARCPSSRMSTRSMSRNG